MSKAEKENNTPETSEKDSHLIGPRQEYRRYGIAPDDSDAGVSGPEHGKPSTPYPY